MKKISFLLSAILFTGFAYFPLPSTIARPVLLPPSAALDTMLLLKGGTFQMGNADQSDAKPIHSVTLSDFYLAATEVTNAQYCAFLNEKGNQKSGGVEWINLSGQYEQEKCRLRQFGNRFAVEDGYDDYPVIFVSWYGAKAYCDWLTAKSTGKRQYRLPTEAEWEYAAGGGEGKNRTTWAGTSDEPQLYRYGNFCESRCNEFWKMASQSDGYAYVAPVGKFQSNSLGLFDMSGNVYEWCSDRYDADYYQKPAEQNPIGPATGAYRVFRGGAWNDQVQACYVNRRGDNVPTYRGVNLGFRVASTS